ncbi:putative Bracovirus protein MdBV-1-27 [Microplitis demolitor]
MNVAIDFHIYKSSNNYLTIKEYAIIELNPYTRENTVLEHNVVLPNDNWEKLSEISKNSYAREAQLFGISWDFGNIEYNTMVENFNTYLSICSRVFVRDETIKNCIINLFDVDLLVVNIIVLSELGYIEIFPKGSTCNYHDNTESNCAMVNAKNMLNWYIEYFNILFPFK